MSIVAELESSRAHSTTVAKNGTATEIDREFVATLAHEIRNILSPLGGSLELLNMRDIDDETAGQAREVIGRQVRQLQRLVSDLLDAHRIGYQRIQIMPSWTDLSAVLESICEDHRPVFASHGIALALNLKTRPLWLNVDVGRLDQAVNNLLSNSLKFTDRGGSVRITLSVDVATHSAAITVSDTGIGIEHAAIHRIFELHAHDSSCRNVSGLGLGLPLAKRLVELHGGHLAARSDGLGRGAEFQILLPLAT